MKTTLIPTLVLLSLLGNAAGTFSLLEINPLHGNQYFAFTDSNRTVYGAGSLASITEFKSNLYFIAQNGYDNEELWTSNGTPSGTHLVKDLNPNGSAQIGNIVVLNNKMLFMAADNNNWDFDMFVSDGTSSGTEKLMDVSEGWNDALTDARAGIAGGKLFFTTGVDLKCTDGSVAGTNTILSVQGGYSQVPGNFTEHNGKIYFTKGNSLGRIEVWETDGTSQNTHQFIDLSADTINNIWGVSKIFSFDGRLFMLASGFVSGLFEVSSNGTLSKITFTGGNDNYLSNLHIESGQLFFTAANGNFSNTYLYHMAAGSNAPEIVPSLHNVPVGSNRGLSFCNGSIYFVGDNPQQVHVLNIGGLTHSVIDLPEYSMLNYNSETPFLVGGNGNIFFAAEETATSRQVLLQSNGTTEGTVVIKPQGSDIASPFNTIQGCGTSSVFDFKMFGNKVVVPANFNDAGRELWLYEPEATTTAVPEPMNQIETSIFPIPASSELNIRLAGKLDGGTLLRIVDMQGKVVIQRVITDETTGIDVASLAAGNYCLSVADGAKSLVTKKFTIAR